MKKLHNLKTFSEKHHIEKVWQTWESQWAELRPFQLWRAFFQWGVVLTNKIALKEWCFGTSLVTLLDYRPTVWNAITLKDMVVVVDMEKAGIPSIFIKTSQLVKADWCQAISKNPSIYNILHLDAAFFVQMN